RRRARPTRELTEPQFWELDLGPDPRGSAFASEFLRRAAWETHRADLMEGGNYGTRPAGFWWYDAPPIEAPDFDSPEDARLRYLATHGLLSDEEIGALL